MVMGEDADHEADLALDEQMNREFRAEMNAPTDMIHSSITLQRLMDANERRRMTLDDPGFCLVCGNEQAGTEPDARKYRCEACGARAVFGAEELLLRVLP